MKVFLTSAYSVPAPDYGPRWLLGHARGGMEHIVERPEDADVILFVERYQGDDPFYRKIHASDHFKRWPEKCMLYHSSDATVPFCRTITPSNDRRMSGGKSRRTFHYIARYCENEHVNVASDTSSHPKFLYSFQGARMTHAVRSGLLDGKHPDGMMLDNGNLTHHMLTDKERINFEKRYVELIQASLFVLCPRGFGPCSYRLFETMQLGRVPVIISDDWVRVPGVPWEECSLTIPEAEIGSIPDLLNARLADAQEMGAMARRVWESHFSPDVSLRRIVDAAKDLMSRPYGLLERCADGANLLRRPYNGMAIARLLQRLRGGHRKGNQ